VRKRNVMEFKMDISNMPHTNGVVNIFLAEIICGGMINLNVLKEY
jgi:hypothetical protein